MIPTQPLQPPDTKSELRHWLHQAIWSKSTESYRIGVSEGRKKNEPPVNFEKWLALRRSNAKSTRKISGNDFKVLVAQYLEIALIPLLNIGPRKFKILRSMSEIVKIDGYQHLVPVLVNLLSQPQLKVSFDDDQLLKPDIIIAREPESDSQLNLAKIPVVDSESPLYSPLRKSNNNRLILHASISCKWTIRSDRSQNARTEALNLIRNRKGKVPHAVAVTAEPLPSRLGSIAYGTGDLDCIYHVALPELIKVCEKYDDADELMVMVEGRRLRDISDLPLDLAI